MICIIRNPNKNSRNSLSSLIHQLLFVSIPNSVWFSLVYEIVDFKRYPGRSGRIIIRIPKEMKSENLMRRIRELAITGFSFSYSLLYHISLLIFIHHQRKTIPRSVMLSSRKSAKGNINTKRHRDRERE